MDDDRFWTNRFHWCALAAGFIAASEGRVGDSHYVRDLAYRMFEEGAFRDRVAAAEQNASPLPASDAATAGLTDPTPCAMLDA